MQAVNSGVGKIKVKVARFTEPTKDIELNEGATVKDLIEAAGITLGGNESLWVDGVRAEQHYTLDEGDMVQIVGSKEGGLK